MQNVVIPKMNPISVAFGALMSPNAKIRGIKLIQIKTQLTLTNDQEIKIPDNTANTILNLKKFLSINFIPKQLPLIL